MSGDVKRYGLVPVDGTEPGDLPNYVIGRTELGMHVLASDFDALRRRCEGMEAVLRKIAAERPGDTGVDMGRPGGDCRQCENLIEMAEEALRNSKGAM